MMRGHGGHLPDDGSPGRRLPVGTASLLVVVDLFETFLVGVRVDMGGVVALVAVLVLVLDVRVGVLGVRMGVGGAPRMLVLVGVRSFVDVVVGHDRSLIGCWLAGVGAGSARRCSTWRSASSSSVEM